MAKVELPTTSFTQEALASVSFTKEALVNSADASVAARFGTATFGSARFGRAYQGYSWDREDLEASPYNDE